MHLCINLPTKWQTVIRMKYRLCSVWKSNTNMMEKKWLCKILHIAGLLNSENPIQIQTETFIKHVLPVTVRAINRQRLCKARARPTQAQISFWIKVSQYLILRNCILHNLFRSNQWCSSKVVRPLQATTSQPLTRLSTKQILERLFWCTFWKHQISIYPSVRNFVVGNPLFSRISSSTNPKAVSFVSIGIQVA